MFVQHHLLTVLTNIEAEKTNSLGGVRSQTFEKKTTVEGVCGVCVVDSWFTASPGLSQTDWTLAGWGCTPGVPSHHGTQDKPAINTHTQEEPLAWQLEHQLSKDHLLSNKDVEHLPVSCVGGPQGKAT